MSNHVLKTHPGPFEEVWAGRKSYEIRVSDRDFAVGDTLELREFEPSSEWYSGRKLIARVTYMTRGGEWGLPPNLCVLGIKVLTWTGRLP